MARTFPFLFFVIFVIHSDHFTFGLPVNILVINEEIKIHSETETTMENSKNPNFSKRSIENSNRDIKVSSLSNSKNSDWPKNGLKYLILSSTFLFHVK